MKGPESDLPLNPKFPTNINKDPNKSGNNGTSGNEHGYDIDGVSNPGVPDGPPATPSPHVISSAASTLPSSLMCCKGIII